VAAHQASSATEQFYSLALSSTLVNTAALNLAPLLRQNYFNGLAAMLGG